MQMVNAQKRITSLKSVSVYSIRCFHQQFHFSNVFFQTWLYCVVPEPKFGYNGKSMCLVYKAQWELNIESNS